MRTLFRRVLSPLLLLDFILFVVLFSLTIWKGSAIWHWFVSICGFILLHFFSRVLFSPRVKMLSKLAIRDTTRRKASSALLLFGLMLSSAVVSSSLIVGDSFDATLEDRLVSSLGEVDWTVEGIDPLTSNPLLMNQTRLMIALNQLIEEVEIDGIGVELHQSGTGISPDGSKVNPNVIWLAPDINLRTNTPWSEPIGTPEVTWSQIGGNSADGFEWALVNTALAKSLNLQVADSFTLSWSELLNDETIRKEHTFHVQSIIESDGLGWENANQPILITSLERSQSILNKEGLVSRAVISGNGDVFTGHLNPSVEDKIEDAFANSMIASDAGFYWDNFVPGEIASLTRSSGGGLLSSGDVAGINSALKIIGHDSDAGSFLLTPISGIWNEDERITSLEGEVVIGINSDENGVSIVTDVGVFLSPRNAPSSEFIFTDILDVAFGESVIYLLTKSELILVDLASMDTSTIVENAYDLSQISISGSTLFAISGIQNNGTYFKMNLTSSQFSFVAEEIEFEGEAIGAEIYSDADAVVILFQTLFNSQLCWINVEVPDCSDIGESNIAFIHQNEIFIGSSSSIKWWNGSGFQEVFIIESSVLGANEGGLILHGEASVFVWSPSLFTFVEDLPISTEADGRAFSEWDGVTYSSTSYGVVIIENGGNTTSRIFSTFDAGLGIHLPPFFLAMEGDIVSHLIGENDAIRLKPHLEFSNLNESYFLGRNMDDDFRMEVSFHPESVDISEFLLIDSDLNMISPAIIGTMSMDVAAELLGGTPRRSMILVEIPQDDSNATIVMQALEDWANRRADILSSSASLNAVKSESIESIEGAGSSFSTLFLIFGTFLVLAGLLLIVNLWIMTTEDRSQQFGLLRAIGASNNDVEWLLRIEGIILSLPGSIFGSILGLGIAGLLMSGLDSFFETTFGIGFSFAWTANSLIIGAMSGFLLSAITLRVSSFVLSRRNSISSLRGLSSNFSTARFWGLIASIFLIVGAIVSLIMSFVFNEISTGIGYSLRISSISILLFSLILPVEGIFRKMLSKRPRILGVVQSRNEVAWLFSSTLIGTLVIVSCLFFSRGSQSTDSSLIISGVFLIVAGVLIASSFGPFIARKVLGAIAKSKPKMSAIFSLSIAYPQSSPFRTAASMAMYSIVLFALIALSGYSALFASYISDLGENSRGEYDLIMTSSGQEMDISPLFDWSDDDLERNGIESFTIMDVGLCIIRGNDGNSTYSILRGVPLSFLEVGALPLSEWDSSLGDSAADVWAEVLSNPNLAIVDASIGMESYSLLGSLPAEGRGLSPGSIIEIRDPLRPMVQTNLRVAGVLTEDASLLLSGVLVSSDVFSSLAESSNSMGWLALSEEVDVSEVASNLQLEFGSEGANVLVVDELFDQVRIILISLLGLLRAFLALGLFIGVSGLAVVTARSINERKQQIGVIRAIGMQSKQVAHSILIEVGWISGIGVINGVLAGLVFHYLLFQTYIENEGASFVVPWSEFIFIIFLSLFMTLLAVIPTVRNGSSVSPNQAMRHY